MKKWKFKFAIFEKMNMIRTILTLYIQNMANAQLVKAIQKPFIKADMPEMKT